MPHKLLIEYALDQNSELKVFLKPHEVVMGEPYSISISITNLGEESFPGGKIESGRIDYLGVGLAPAYQDLTDHFSFEEIGPGRSIKIKLFEQTMPVREGDTWIRVKIASRDGQSIEYYQKKDERLKEDEWLNVFQVVNRQLLQIIQLLNKLERKE